MKLQMMKLLFCMMILSSCSAWMMQPFTILLTRPEFHEEDMFEVQKMMKLSGLHGECRFVGKREKSFQRPWLSQRSKNPNIYIGYTSEKEKMWLRVLKKSPTTDYIWWFSPRESTCDLKNDLESFHRFCLQYDQKWGGILLTSPQSCDRAIQLLSTYQQMECYDKWLQ